MYTGYFFNVNQLNILENTRNFHLYRSNNTDNQNKKVPIICYVFQRLVKHNKLINIPCVFLDIDRLTIK